MFLKMFSFFPLAKLNNSDLKNKKIYKHNITNILVILSTRSIQWLSILNGWPLLHTWCISIMCHVFLTPRVLSVCEWRQYWNLSMTVWNNEGRSFTFSTFSQTTNFLKTARIPSKYEYIHKGQKRTLLNAKIRIYKADNEHSSSGKKMQLVI